MSIARKAFFHSILLKRTYQTLATEWLKTSAITSQKGVSLLNQNEEVLAELSRNVGLLNNLYAAVFHFQIIGHLRDIQADPVISQKLLGKTEILLNALIETEFDAHSLNELNAFINASLNLNIPPETSLSSVLNALKEQLFIFKKQLGIGNNLAHLSLKTLGEQLELQKKAEGMWRRYIQAQPSMTDLKNFYHALNKKNSERQLKTTDKDYEDRPLSIQEIYDFFIILINATYSPGHITETVFENLKREFGLTLLQNLKGLHEQKLLTPDIFQNIITHVNPASIASATLILNRSVSLNTSANWQLITQAPDPEKEAKKIEAFEKIQQRLKSLRQWDITRTYVESHPDIITLKKALDEPSTAFIMLPAYITAIVKHKNPMSMVKAFNLMFLKSEYHTDVNRKKVIESDDPEATLKDMISFDAIYTILITAKLADKKNLETIQKRGQLQELETVLALIQVFCPALLTQETLEIIVSHDHPCSMGIALMMMYVFNISNTDKYQLIEQEDNPALVLGAILIQDNMGFLQSNIWLQMLDTLLKIYKINLLESINRLSKEYLESSLNFSQNTHLASIRESASKSAVKITKRYAGELKKIGLTHDYTEIKKWACDLLKDRTSHFESDPLDINASLNEIMAIYNKPLSAHNMIQWILFENKFNFVDPESQVDIKTALLACWFAIHDKSVLQGTYEDAEANLIDALYEIKRGENINNDKEVDNLTEEDLPICRSGAFNKLLSKLYGLHPDIEIRIVTRLQASLKLPQVVKQEVLNYIDTHRNLDDYQTIIAELASFGVEVIWEKIKPVVQDSLFEEFKEIYGEITNPAFVQLIEHGKSVGIDELLEIEKLTASLLPQPKRTEDKSPLTTSGYQMNHLFAKPNISGSTHQPSLHLQSAPGKSLS